MFQLFPEVELRLRVGTYREMGFESTINKLFIS